MPQVLVVDDNPATRYSTTRVLRSSGFGVREAATGLEGLDRADAAVDLVVLDVHLPDIDGFEVCRRLRANPVTSRTPVIHLSAAFIKDVDKVQGLDAGANGYLTHPVEPPVLVAAVNAFLRTAQAEDALRASEARFRAVFENALHGIALLSEEMVFLEVNPAVCAIFGRDRDQIVDKHLSAFSAASGGVDLGDLTRRLVSDVTWRGESPILRADGERVDVEWSMSAHSVPGIRLAMMTDVTARKEGERERERLLASERAARAEAERANQVKDDFMAALSHELRTPLNAIVGWSQVLKQRVGSHDPDVVSGVLAIERNARVQAQLIADLLDISRITSGKLELDRQWIEPASTLRAAVATFVASAEARGITVELDSPEELAPTFWDAARFQQVIWNLLDNAIKFSNTGGKVRVVASQHPHTLEIAVHDEGRGISPEFLLAAFEPFRQEYTGTRRGHGGLGLGLAIVKQLVDAHGGEIVAESAGVGHGSCFRVRVPTGLARPQAPLSAEHEAHPSQLHGIRVLVVEDDQDARVLASRLLRAAGAEVSDVADADAAAALATRLLPAVLVSDIGMPGQDGYDLIRRLRADGLDASQLPAIALTAFAQKTDRERALVAGFQMHLSKPVSPNRLLTAVHTLASGFPSVRRRGDDGLTR
jgi:PAS domain S-box-containing protein